MGNSDDYPMASGGFDVAHPGMPNVTVVTVHGVAGERDTDSDQGVSA